jgi:hypothetical protein
MSEGMELEARNTRESAQSLHDALASVVRPLTPDAISAAMVFVPEYLWLFGIPCGSAEYFDHTPQIKSYEQVTVPDSPSYPDNA